MSERAPYHPRIDAMIDYLNLRSYAADLSPEEYVARTAHQHVLGGPFGYHHPDPTLDAWMGRVSDLLRDPRAVRAVRQQYLTQQEIAAAEAYEQDSL